MAEPHDASKPTPPDPGGRRRRSGMAEGSAVGASRTRQQRRTLENAVTFGRSSSACKTVSSRRSASLPASASPRAIALRSSSAAFSRYSPARSVHGRRRHLGRKSEREVVQATIDMEKREMAADPQGEFTELVAYYKLKGFSAAEAEMIVKRLTQIPLKSIFTKWFATSSNRSARRTEDAGLRAPFAMGCLLRLRLVGADPRLHAAAVDAERNADVAAVRARRLVRRRLLRGNAERAERH